MEGSNKERLVSMIGPSKEETIKINWLENYEENIKVKTSSLQVFTDIYYRYSQERAKSLVKSLLG